MTGGIKLTKEEACQLLGIDKKSSRSEIKVAYLRLVKTELCKETPNDEQLALYQEAYDCLFGDYIKKSDMMKPINQGRLLRILLMIGIGVMSFMIVYRLEHYLSQESEQSEPLTVWLSNKDEYISVLASTFELEIGEFSTIKEVDWIYQDLGEYWFVTVPIKIKEAHSLGALLSTTQFRLEEDVSTTLSQDVLAQYECLSEDHQLSEYYELVPQDEVVIVSFYVKEFEVDETRGLYFDYPNGEVVNLGIIIFEGEAQTDGEDPMEFVNR